MKKALALFAVLLLLGGCNGAKAQRCPVTLLHAGSLPAFEALVEATYPDIDLQVECIETAMLNNEVMRRLQTGSGPDLIVTTQPAAGDADKPVLDLSRYAFSTKYENTTLRNIAGDGRVYYLPLPGNYYGFVINRTLYDQAGIERPATLDAMIRGLTALREKSLGVGGDNASFAFQTVDSVSLGTYVIGGMVPDFLSKPEGIVWLADFTNKKTAFSGNWDGAFFFFEQLMQKRLINQAALSANPDALPVEERMGTGELAAAYGDSSMLRACRQRNDRLAAAGGPRYRYEMLPFFSNEGNENWTVTAPAAYIGINRALEDDEKKRGACRRVLELLSTKTGQQAVANDTAALLTYLKGCRLAETGVRTGLEEQVEGGYVYGVKFPGRITEYLGRNALGVVSGKLSVTDCFAAVDNVYQYEPGEAAAAPGYLDGDLPYGTYDTRLRETALGNLVADSAAAYSGAPIALIGSGCIRSGLYQGPVTGADLAAVCPGEGRLLVVEMTGKTVRELLENGVSDWQDGWERPSGRFLLVSGLRYVFDSSRPPGGRLLEAVLEDQTELDGNAVYTVAVHADGAFGGGALPGDARLIRDTGGTCRDALEAYLSKEGAAVAPAAQGRIVNRAEGSE